MDDLDLVKMKLSRVALDELREIEAGSGVPYGTIWNIKKRKTKNPRYPTVKALADYFKAKAA